MPPLRIKAGLGSELRRIDVERDTLTFAALVADLSIFFPSVFPGAVVQFADEDGDVITLASDRELASAVSGAAGTLRLFVVPAAAAIPAATAVREAPVATPTPSTTVPVATSIPAATSALQSANPNLDATTAFQAAITAPAANVVPFTVPSTASPTATSSIPAVAPCVKTSVKNAAMTSDAPLRAAVINENYLRKMFDTAANTHGNSNPLLSLGACYVGQSLSGFLPEIPGASGVQKLASEKASEACAALQSVLGPLVHVSLIVSDARTSVSADAGSVRKRASERSSRVMIPRSFTSAPVVLFSPVLLPLQTISGLRPTCRPDSELRPREVMCENLRRKSAHVLGAVKETLNAGLAVHLTGGEETSVALNSALQEIRAGFRSSSRALFSGSRRSSSATLSRLRLVKCPQFPTGMVPVWYSGKGMKLVVDDVEPETVPILPSIAAVSDADILRLYTALLTLLHRASALGGPLLYSAFTAPYLPGVLRIPNSDGSAVVTWIDGDMPRRDSREVTLLSASVMARKSFGGAALRGVLSLLVAREESFRLALALLVPEDSPEDSRERKRPRTSNAS